LLVKTVPKPGILGALWFITFVPARSLKVVLSNTAI